MSAYWSRSRQEYIPNNYNGSRLYDRWVAFVHRKRCEFGLLLVSDSKTPVRWVTMDEWLSDIPDEARIA